MFFNEVLESGNQDWFSLFQNKKSIFDDSFQYTYEMYKLKNKLQ